MVNNDDGVRDVNENMKWVADTNFLYDHLDNYVDKHDIVLVSTVRLETDNHKTAMDKNLQYKARRVNRFIFENYDKFTHDVGEYIPEKILGKDYSSEVFDYRIIASAKANGYGILTGDLNMYSTAKAFGIPVKNVNEENDVEDSEYTGIKKIYISNSDEETQEKYSMIYQDLSNNVFNLLTNQYLIVYDKDKPMQAKDSSNMSYEVLDKFRFDGEKHVRLVLPHKKIIKAKNEEQECAIDLLMNQDVPIKIISGQVGSGKTYLAANMALYHVLEKGNQAKILALRNPIGSGSVDIGYLKGSKEDKTADFFKPFEQQLPGGEQESEILKSRGQLEADIPYYIKGQTFTDTNVVVDEAEDLDVKQFNLIGTRVGENSVITFVGDVKQAEEMFKNNNGLLFGIENLKGNPKVGIVVLSEDIRSEVSRVFADLSSKH